MAKKKGGGSAATPAQSDAKASAGAVKKKGANPLEFIQQVRNEGSKITWTTWKELRVSTIMVLVMVILAAIFFFAVDQVLSFIVRTLLSFGV